jgi:hypothetical protein
MLIIPIDNFKASRKGINGDPEPKMFMKSNGNILCNVAAARLLKMEEGPNFIHFYEDNDNLYIKKDNDSIHAITIVYIAKSAKCSVYSKSVANYFINKLMPVDKSITFLVSAADFGKFSITPII